MSHSAESSIRHLMTAVRRKGKADLVIIDSIGKLFAPILPLSVWRRMQSVQDEISLQKHFYLCPIRVNRNNAFMLNLLQYNTYRNTLNIDSKQARNRYIS